MKNLAMRLIAMGSLALFCMPLSVRAERQGAMKLYVSVRGNDLWSGKLPAPNRAKTDGPFASLERARDAIRQRKQAGALPKGGVTVEIGAGLYELARPLALTAEDSGTASAPIVYRAQPDAEVRLVGGKALSGWKPVTDPAILARLDPAAQGKVWQTDLHAQGLTELPSMAMGTGVGQSEPGLELFFQDRPMTLARWPNQGFVKIADTLGIDPVDVRGTKGDKVGKFVYDGDRPKRWAGEKDIWMHGFWFWDWSDQRQKVEAIDTEKRIITLAKPYHHYGYRKGQWYYAYNLLAELDQPEEWYLNRDSGILYFWPPAPIESGKAMISLLPTLVTMEQVAHVTLQGVTLEAARSTGITVQGGDHVRIVGCVLRNMGGWGIEMSGMKESGVVGCDIYQVGGGGITISGGESKTLTPGHVTADNNHIHHYGRWNPMYTPAIQVSGVGNRITHNLIHDAPHMAILFSGQDHLIEFNEIHDVCTGSNDAGAIYAGRDWAMRGTLIRYNYLHHISGFQGRGCVGVYLDDQFSGTQVYGNLFVKVSRAAMIGGGRDCAIENNVFVDCVPATHVDARGLGWAADTYDTLLQRLEAMPYKQPPWSTRFPRLVNILNDDSMAPKGDVIARNICVGGRWGDFEDKAKPLVTFKDNLLDTDPHFVDAAHGDYRLRPDSPAFKLGFQSLPLEKIGLYLSPERKKKP